jgi:hypothetical protein
MGSQRKYVKFKRIKFRFERRIRQTADGLNRPQFELSAPTACIHVARAAYSQQQEIS